MHKPQFHTNHIYHIYNRGVEKRTIVKEEKDYFRFLHDLFEFNDVNPIPASNIRLMLRNPSRADTVHISQCLEVQPPNIGKRKRQPRKLLVEVLAFCLMPNHYHLLLRQLVEKGIIRFMTRLGVGYTMYFNQKYNRVGPLFQGRFKAVAITRDAHFIHLPYYIHANPLDLQMTEWRQENVSDTARALRIMEKYRWSSFPDYIGKKNFPSVTQREFLSEFFGGPQKHKQAVTTWLKEMDLELIQDFVIEKD